MTGIYEFCASTVLPATPGDVYAFHENPANIRAISPASLRVVSVECGEQAVAGACFTMRVVQFGLPIHWVGFWETVEPGRLLVDGAIRSPFRSWIHRHEFEPHPGGCLMTDRVRCLLPGGLLVTRVVMPIVLTGMFRSRHAATRRWFSRPTAAGPAAG